MQLAFLCSLCVGYSFPPWLYVTLLNFSHDRSNWSSPSFTSTTFKNFPIISEILSDESSFSTQYQFKLQL
jgi:hypothetical protein